MEYNFDEIIQRRGSNSYKWDSAQEDNILPMWVADMDFRTAPSVIEALHKRAEHGIFGYSKVPQAYYNSILSWFERRHNFILNKDWIVFTSGVVPALSAIIQALTVSGDKVLVQTPVYNCFFSSIHNNQCEIITNQLIYKNSAYSIDFDDFEKKSSDPKVKLFLLCNPHNPVGRVWTKEELQRIGDICIRNNVLVISDEIHCDLVYKDYTHIPFASINKEFLQNSVTCIAPTKTFNLAGIQVANIVAKHEEIRNKIDRSLNINEVCEINVFAIEALMAAYNEGEDWLEKLKEYLFTNYIYLVNFFKEKLPYITVIQLEATYLVWIDCSECKQSSHKIAETLRKNERLWVNDGTMYGNSGEGFIRINIACPRSVLVEGLSRLYNVLKDKKTSKVSH